MEVQHGIEYFQGAYDVFSGLFVALFPLMVIRDLGIARGLRWPFYILSATSVTYVYPCPTTRADVTLT